MALSSIFIFDWGDTLMRDIKGQEGKMCDWPHVEAMPGAKNLLQALSKKALIYVATNAADSSVEDIIKALVRAELAPYIDGCFCRDNIGYCKPEPQFYLSILDRLNVEPQEVSMIGDSLDNDILPARNLGMQAYWLNADESIDSAPEGVTLIRSLDILDI